MILCRWKPVRLDDWKEIKYQYEIYGKTRGLDSVEHRFLKPQRILVQNKIFLPIHIKYLRSRLAMALNMDPFASYFHIFVSQ